MKNNNYRRLFNRAIIFQSRSIARLCALLLVFILSAEAIAQRQAQGSFRSKFGPNYLVGYLAYTPVDYAANPTKSYPILIFLHGTDEKAWKPTDLSQLYKVKKNGPPKEIEAGKDFPFIVISPQCPFGGWDDITMDDFATSQWRPGEFVDEIIEKMKTLYRVDPNRIYITGLSMGGASTWEYVAAYPTKAAAAIPIAGWPITNASKICGIGKTPIWGFQGANDNGSGMTNFVNSINACTPTPNPLAKITVYPNVGHDAWTQTYNNQSTSEDIYAWLMKYSRSTSVPPVANAGTDKSITLPANSLSITGTGTDSDGTIASYAWTKVSGGAATLTNANTATVSLSGLVAGTYVFRLTVTDNTGATGFDDVTVVVNAAVNVLPVANAGADKSITLPTNSLSITGTGTDSDGTIASYAWTKVSGGTATLANANTATVSLSGLVAGTYVFRLTVTDNRTGTGSDDVIVVVNPAVNVAPVANAGVDKSITLPTNSLSITGTGTDSDGTIASYAWTKVSGGTATLTNANTATVSLSGLVAGTYVFRLTVTDNNTATGSDDVTVIVNPAPTGTGDGLKAEYFNGVNLAGTPLLTRVDPTVNFDWLAGSPDAVVPVNQFSARWTGQIKPLYSEAYTFYTFSDDGIRLYVNNTLVIDNWTYHGAVENTGNITLVAGQLYDIRLEYFEGNSMATAKLSWSTPINQQKQVIPQTQLYSNTVVPGVGLKGEYFNSLDFTGTALTRVDSVINFDWNNNPPFTGVNTDNYSVRWTGKIKADFSETFTFYTLSDDGVRLWVNNTLLIDNWTNHAAVENNGTIALTAGQLYDIRMEYYEKTSLATSKLLWSSTNVQKKVIPRANLYLPAATRQGIINADAFNINADNLKLNAFPNPAGNSVNINYTASVSGNAELMLLDGYSNQLLKKTISVQAGENSVSLNLSDIKSGLYMLVISGEGNKAVTKLVVNK
ncbi:MAG: T9SS type A sorting domain-containing protein [Sporocytophaga sp.]|uniref:PKD domain-containing protein n=1 Tax=Sporocytophaga sp. TaxID=2231183 RepID=UPI001B0F469C|nr:PA14 domain-containing protein [Sporocytophaga sp.]MBO9703541.1 T9SS type A sorting domain-containing protein [Sporocytophaga sp.]